MFPAYLMFLEELTLKQPELLWSNLNTIKNILSVVLVENQQDQIFFNFVNKVVIFFDLKTLRDSALLNAILQITLQAIFDSQNSSTNKENNKTVRGSLSRNVLVFWCLCIAKFTFEEFLQDVSKVHLPFITSLQHVLF